MKAKWKRFWIKALAALPLARTVVLLQDGKAEAKRGKARPALLAEIGDLSRQVGVDIACIHADHRGGASRLRFFGITVDFHQRFRNVWSAWWR